MPFTLPTVATLDADDTDYIAKMNSNFDSIETSFQSLTNFTQSTVFLEELLPLAAALGLTIPTPPTIEPPTIIDLSLGEKTYIADLNANFAAVVAAFEAIQPLVIDSTILNLGRLVASVLGGLPCLVGNHSYFCSQGADVIWTQVGYAWLPSIPAIVQNSFPRSQSLAGGDPTGEFWYMHIDKTGFPTWVLGDKGQTTNAFFRVWVVLAPGEWLIFPPEQLLPTFQLVPGTLAVTPAHP